MNKHHLAHYLIEAAIVGLLLCGAAAISRRFARSEWPALNKAAIEGALQSDMKRSVRITCLSNCGALPAELDDAFESIGWLHARAAAFGNTEGIVVSPDDADGHRLASALGSALGVSVDVTTVDDAGLDIIIGRKP